MKKFGFTFIVMLAWLFFSCDMFAPRTVENPINQTYIDPFRLFAILDKTGEKFSKTSYEDIFDTNFQFIAWDNAAFTRENEIEHLKTLQASYPCSISTTWDSCEVIGEIRNDTSMALCRTYFVQCKNQPDKMIDTGEVRFFLNRQAGNIWKISIWQENVKRSIFHP